MEGYISSWKLGNDSITRCPTGDVFPFDPADIIDAALAAQLAASGPFNDLGPCPGNVQVTFTVSGGFAVNIARRVVVV
jgi:hypothetical protein